MLADWSRHASIGGPAAMRPESGSSPASLSVEIAEPGSAPEKSPRITVGEKRLFSAAPGTALSSGNFMTSSARARCARRRMKPRSSRPLIRRWIPDLERRFRASFISSKEGDTPVAVSLWLMNINSSCCFLVSMASSRLWRNKSKTPDDVLLWFTRSVKQDAGNAYYHIIARLRRNRDGFAYWLSAARSIGWPDGDAAPHH